MNENDIDEIIREHNAETRKEYEEIKSRITNGTAEAQDYVLIIDYADLVNEKMSEAQKQDYLHKAYSAAQNELLSSDDEKRESAYLALAQYYEKLKDYPNALKNYDNAAELNPHHIIIRARFKALKMNDIIGARKDYELAKSKGLSEPELHLFKLLVEDSFESKVKSRLFIVCFVFFVIAAIVYCYLEFFRV